LIEINAAFGNATKLAGHHNVAHDKPRAIRKRIVG
jgi:hypothetical protein